MGCVLRVFGKNLDVHAVTNSATIVPYRIDERGSDDTKINCLHYDVFSEDCQTFTQSIALIRKFMQTNEPALREMAKRKDVEGMTVDLAINILASNYLKNLSVDIETIRDLASFGLALTLSLYKVSDIDESS